MAETGDFFLPNEIMRAWINLDPGKDEQYLETINGRNVVITVQKRETDTKFNVQDYEPQTNDCSEPKSPEPTPRKQRTSLRRNTSTTDKQVKPPVKRSRRLAEKKSESYDGIKSRLRRPGFSPLLALNKMKWTQISKMGKYRQQATKTYTRNTDGDSKTKPNIKECKNVVKTEIKYMEYVEQCTDAVAEIEPRWRKVTDKALFRWAGEESSIQRCFLCPMICVSGDKMHEAFKLHLCNSHKVFFNDHLKVIKATSISDKRFALEAFKELSKKNMLHGWGCKVCDHVEKSLKLMLVHVRQQHSNVRGYDHLVDELELSKEGEKDAATKPAVKLEPVIVDSCGVSKYVGLFDNVDKKPLRSRTKRGARGVVPFRSQKKRERRGVVFSPDDYKIKDSVLASLKEGQNECMLCGRIVKDKTRFSNHLYFWHKVNHLSYGEVLQHDDLNARKAALSKLREHSKSQMVISGKHCPICYRAMLVSKNLIRHMTSHSEHPEYEQYLAKLNRSLEICDRFSNLSFKRKRKRKRRVENEEEVTIQFKGSAACGVCNREFRNGLQLRRHLNTLHLMAWVDYMALVSLPADEKKLRLQEIMQQRKTRCNNSLEEFPIDYNYQAWIIECAVCKDNIPCEKYKSHLQSDHPELNNITDIISQMEIVLRNSMATQQSRANVACPYCDTKIPCSQVARHMKMSHRQEADYGVTLQQINAEVRKILSRLRTKGRKERIALGIKLFCRHCGSPFTDHSTKSYHENYSCMKNEKRKTRYSCKFCGRRGTNEAWYKEHIKQHNPKGPNYICALCGNGYMNKSGLDAHKARDHNNIKRYSCNLCGKEFYVRSHFKSHMLKHSIERGHVCDLCSKKFKSVGCLRRHIRTVHLQQYKYKCELCGHGTEKEEAINRHVCSKTRRVQTALETKDHSSMLQYLVEPAKNSTEAIQAHESPTIKSEVVPVAAEVVVADGYTSSSPETMLPPDAQAVSSTDTVLVSTEIDQSQLVMARVDNTVLTHANVTEQTLYIEQPISMKAVNHSLSTLQGILPAHLHDVASNLTATNQSYQAENNPVQYEISVSQEVPSTGENENLQYVEEIYVDEGGNIITRAPQVSEMEQIIVSRTPEGSQIEQIIEAAELQNTHNLIIVNGEQTVGDTMVGDTMVELPSFIWMNADSEQA